MTPRRSLLSSRRINNNVHQREATWDTVTFHLLRPNAAWNEGLGSLPSQRAGPGRSPLPRDQPGSAGTSRAPARPHTPSLTAAPPPLTQRRQPPPRAGPASSGAGGGRGAAGWSARFRQSGVWRSAGRYKRRLRVPRFFPWRLL